MNEIEKKAAKRTGRPPKNPELGKRINVMFRLNQARRDRLMADAEHNGRSMSEEIEHRLDRSYADVDLVRKYFGRPETVELASAISSLAERIERETGKEWKSDPYTARQFYDAINRIMYLYFEKHMKLEMGGNLAAMSNDKDDPEKLDFFLGTSCADALSITMGLDTPIRAQWEEFMRSKAGAAESASGEAERHSRDT